jgi:hypothetical protein
VVKGSKQTPVKEVTNLVEEVRRCGEDSQRGMEDWFGRLSNNTNR